MLLKHTKDSYFVLVAFSCAICVAKIFARAAHDYVTRQFFLATCVAKKNVASCKCNVGNTRHYLIVESVSFVLLRDVCPINPKRTIKIINLRDVYRHIP